ncbi:hypothetical protein NJ76_16095 [Rhodococcus sp. IITR03]|nr:hypothetical protein NJ76_16095 [Rhodococcus sp. IITR03]
MVVTRTLWPGHPRGGSAPRGDGSAAAQAPRGDRSAAAQTLQRAPLHIRRNPCDRYAKLPSASTHLVTLTVEAARTVRSSIRVR